jgi:predicted HTH transcriptional regulator
MEGAVIKTVAAFLNTDGGVLLIGVNDRKQVLGLEADYKTLTTKPNKDGFELALQQVLSKAIGADFYVRDVRVGFCNMDGKGGRCGR